MGDMGDLIAVLATLLPSAAADPCLVVEGLDVQRQIAYARADPAALAAVYAEGSAAGTADRQMLTEYRDRGITVRGARLERRSCERLADDRVRSVERLGTAVAVLHDATQRALPRDNWNERDVTLVVEEGRWRIRDVREVG